MTCTSSRAIVPVAHLSGSGEPQPLSEHLTGVSKLCSRLAAKIGLARAGSVIGLLHDLGKYSSEFQAYLLSFQPGSEVEPQDELRGRIDHSTAGAQQVHRQLTNGNPQRTAATFASELLALCIASHHSGLIDCLAPDGLDGLTQRLLKEEVKSHCDEGWRHADASIRATAEQIISDPGLVVEIGEAMRSILMPKPNSLEHPQVAAVKTGLLARFLFSCLIDADRCDTAAFESPHAANHRANGAYVSWEVLASRLENHLAHLPAETAVDRLRRSVSAECMEASPRPQGIYTLTVPTGGGKTLASLRFALEHAHRYGLDRIVFVSPYISIVDQNASVAREILEPEGTPFASIVLEHHSNLAEEKDTWRSKLLAENWDAPVVFTTAVQVLEALFGTSTRSARRLHALARAVIVFDEVQTLPVRSLHLFNNAINFLAEQCGSTVLLCTATQPLLSRLDHAQGSARLAPDPELISDVARLFQALQRYEVFDHTAKPGGWSHQEVSALVCAEATEHGSCLIVVNTKRDARRLYELCRASASEGSTVLHLSTAMCPAHRTEALTTLRVRLRPESRTGPVLCISTQLIEAGVDIDFAVVVRDLAGLDSIAQAAGRCNRHGLRHCGRVHIVQLADPLPRQLEDVLKGRVAAERVLGEWRRKQPSQPFPLWDSVQIDSFFENYFFQRRSEMSYPVSRANADREDTLLNMLGRNTLAAAEATARGIPLTRSELLQSFNSAAKQFQSITGSTQGIVVPFRRPGQDVIAALCSTPDLQAEWRLLRKAQQFTVSVFPETMQRLLRAGALREAQPDTGIYCVLPGHYNDEFGLQVDGGGVMEGLFA